jgi:hypothetical protein
MRYWVFGLIVGQRADLVVLKQLGFNYADDVTEIETA